VNQTRLMMVDWAARIDAEIEYATGETEPEDATINNELFISETIDGMTVMQGQFDAELGETLRTAIDLARRMANGTLDEIDKPTDHEGVETDSNDRSTVEEKPVEERNFAEQRADAIGLIARFFLDHNKDLGTNAGERPHVQINIHLNALQGFTGGKAETQHGNTGLTREVALRICCDAKIGRIITRGASETFDVGRLARAVPAPTAKAVRKRDNCCRFPGCDLSYRYTEIHHFVHWINGGPTNVSNLFLLCWVTTARSTNAASMLGPSLVTRTPSSSSKHPTATPTKQAHPASSSRHSSTKLHPNHRQPRPHRGSRHSPNDPAAERYRLVPWLLATEVVWSTRTQGTSSCLGPVWGCLPRRHPQRTVLAQYHRTPCK
jgi:Domain of unknown function (DUF222)